MKKKSVINLIKYYSEKNDIAFRNEALSIANDFDREGDSEIAEYIMSLLSDRNVLIPQTLNTVNPMFEKMEIGNDNLWLPDVIMRDLIGIVNAITHNKGVNKFLFKGYPGTGKTEAVKHVARVLNRDVFCVNFAGIVDSKLGSTAKNIVDLFVEINHFPRPKNLIILFDEIDAIALNRTSQQDHREMGRATSELLHELDRINSEVTIIATTNLFQLFDKALVRRFDAVIDFDRYSEADLLEIGENFFAKYMNEYGLANKDIRLFRKIFSNMSGSFSPGEIKNLIKTAIAFSDAQVEGDYYHRLYELICGKSVTNMRDLKDEGYTIREIAMLTGKSKSTVDRELKENE